MFNTINKELKELLSNKKIWIGLLTVLIIIIIGTSYNKKNQEAVPSEVLRLGVINNDNSTYSELLLNYFNESKTFSNFVNVVTGDSETIQRAFHKGELDIYLVIPKDFARNMTQIKNSPINVTINIKDTTKAILFQNILTSYAKYITAVEANAVGLYDIMEADGMPQKLVTDTNNTISLDLIFTALGKESFFSYQPVDKFPATTVLQYYIISALFITLLYSGLYVGFSILKEAELGTAARIRTTQTSIFKLISVKMFIMCILLTALASLTFYLMFSGMITVISLLFC
ncbi:MAG TPA: ABC transporter permease, partial [Mobilitalea sp.]|nr:ABC transporter permease [Mobilitalea sp.]